MTMVFNFILYIIVFLIGLAFGLCLAFTSILIDKHGVKEFQNMIDNQEESLRLEVRNFFDLIDNAMKLWVTRNNK